MTDVRRAIVGRPARTRPRPSRSYRTGRVCGHEGCTTILSRYNPSGFCSLHESVRFTSGRRRKPRARAGTVRAEAG